MDTDNAVTNESAGVAVATHPHDAQVWSCHTTVEKFDEFGELYETLEVPSNLLMYGGASVQWQTLIGNGTSTAGQSLTFFNNANAAIGVGDSTTAEAATQTDLQATTNKLRKGMDTSYPTHTDGVVAASNTITFRASFGISEGNYTWAEWGIFNSATAATGRMLNRKVQALGTKAANTTWQITITLTLT